MSLEQKSKMKVVFDTNVWLSSIFWKGEAYKIMELCEKEEIEIIISEDILFEIIEVLERESKFQKFLENKNLTIEDLARTILSLTTLINSLRAVIRCIKPIMV